MYCSFYNNQEYQRSKKLLDERLAACINIVPKVQSLFWWEGKIDKTREALLIVKTKGKLFKALERAVRPVHSYSSPEIIALPIVDGSKDYLRWVARSTTKKKSMKT